MKQVLIGGGKAWAAKVPARTGQRMSGLPL